MIQQAANTSEPPFIVELIPSLLFVLVTVFIVYKLFGFFEMAYVEYIKKRLFYNHFYFKKKTLNKEQRFILSKYIKLYNGLSLDHKVYFEHRVATIMNTMEFIGKGIEVSETMKLITSATLVKLTFGFRDYQISSVERILIYPEEFYSQTNKTYHKGEFNPAYRALVMSWKDVLYGYEIDDDNLNLAIHEFIHAIHFYYMSVRRKSTSAAIFLDSFQELVTYLDANAVLKTNLVSSGYLRDYAYTNQFEFLSVIVETFIETPIEFKSKFPKLYSKVKLMLNYNFNGY